VTAAVPAVTPAAVAPAEGAWWTGKITATATAAADARLPAMAPALASVVMSDLLLLRSRRLAVAAGVFVTPVGVLEPACANNFSDAHFAGRIGYANQG
jgi:hypothetical protein